MAISIPVQLALSLFLIAPAQGSSGTQEVIEGKLLVEFGKSSRLITAEREIPLAGADRNISHSIADARLSGKRMRLYGHHRVDGVFEIQQFYSVRPEGLYRLIYFCET
jgi:hypothetical protein